VNKVWPGYCVFPDFTNKDIDPYWENLIAQFLDGVAVDGLWLDMNEIACFCEGEGPCPPPPITPDDNPNYIYNFTNTNKKYVGFDPMNPPYVPGSQYHRTLSAKTLRMDAVTSLGLYYNTHSLYANYEVQSTAKALEKLRNQKRPMIVTRASFAGMGSMAAHWSGDNWSTWKDLRLSLSSVLSMQLFGIPFTGADVCGFLGNTTFELCARWTQVGSLYPFSRNHNGLGEVSQEPYVFGDKFSAMARNVLLNRYSLLLYLYTQFHHASVNAGTVWRPLFVEFPKDDEKFTANNDAQFMIGRALLASPVTTENTTSVNAYFPGTDGWYDYYTGQFASKGREVKTLDAPWDFIPIHIRGGSVVVKQQPALTTAETRKNPITLLVALSPQTTASGDLYLDDGDSLDTLKRGLYTYIEFGTQNLGKSFRVSNKVVKDGYADAKSLRINHVTIYGVVGRTCTVTLSGKAVPFRFNDFGAMIVDVDIGLVDQLDLIVSCN
jgi:alpha-glucosidase (family GH31 glycosyl hydrolase)